MQKKLAMPAVACASGAPFFLNRVAGTVVLPCALDAFRRAFNAPTGSWEGPYLAHRSRRSEVAGCCGIGIQAGRLSCVSLIGLDQAADHAFGLTVAQARQHGVDFGS